MKAKVRQMQEIDVDSVYAIEIATHRSPWSRQILSDCVLVGYDCRVIELEQSRLVGYIICRRNLNIFHILNLCVTLTEQGKGYGKALLQTVLDSLKEDTTIDSVILEVRPSNLAALGLYEKFGFYQDGMKEDYYEDESGTEDAILLKKIVSKD